MEVQLSARALVHNTYLLSGGLVGVVSKFMCRLAFDLRNRESRDISFEDCALSAAKIESVRSITHQPFTQVEVEPIRLQQAHTVVLDEADVKVRKIH